MTAGGKKDAGEGGKEGEEKTHAKITNVMLMVPVKNYFVSFVCPLID